MSSPIEKAVETVARLELEVENHAALHVIKAGYELGECAVEKNLIDCLEKLKKLTDIQEHGMTFYIDVTLQHGTFALSQNE